MNEIAAKESDDSLRRRVAREATWLVNHDVPPLVMAVVARLLEEVSGLALILERHSKEEHDN